MVAGGGPPAFARDHDDARRAVEAGEIRSDISADDVLRALIGMCYMHDQTGWQQSVLRLLDVFVDGLRVGKAQV